MSIRCTVNTQFTCKLRLVETMFFSQFKQPLSYSQLNHPYHVSILSGTKQLVKGYFFA